MSTQRDLDSPKLTDEFRERLRTVFRAYASQPTFEGWRKLALMLLLQYHSEFQPMKGQLSGTKNCGALLWMEKLICEKPAMTRASAANAVAKQVNADKRRRRKVSAKTLQNQFAKSRDKHSSELRFRALQRYESMWNALMGAAMQLERSYDDEPYNDEPPLGVK